MIKRGDSRVRRSNVVVLGWVLAACARAAPAAAVPPTVGTEHEDFIIMVTDERGRGVEPSRITCEMMYIAPRADLAPLVEPCLSWGPEQAFLTSDRPDGRLRLRVMAADQSHHAHGQAYSVYLLRAVVGGRRSYPVLALREDYPDPSRERELHFRLPARGVGRRSPVLRTAPRLEVLSASDQNAAQVALSVGFVDPSGGPVQVEWHFRGRIHGMHEARTSVGLFYGEQTVVALACTMDCAPAFLNVNLPPPNASSFVVEPPNVQWDHFPKGKPPSAPKK